MIKALKTSTSTTIAQTQSDSVERSCLHNRYSEYNKQLLRA